MAITINSLTPTNPIVFAGGSLTFSVSATSNISGATLAYLWQTSSSSTGPWLTLPDNGANSITLTNIPITASGDYIRVAISESTPYSPVTYNYTVTGTGSSSWTFTGSASGNNPSLTATVGDTLRFAVSSTNSNTFYIKTAAVGGTGSTVSTGITNNGTQNNTVVWNTAGAAAGTYYYISAENPNNMVGVITLAPATTTLVSTVNSDEVPGFQRQLTVNAPPLLSVSDQNLTSYTVATGSSLSFTVEATTNSSLSNFINTTSANVTPIVFQWQQSTDGGTTWTNITAGTNIAITDTLLSFATTPVQYYKRSVLTLSNIAFTQNNRRYRCQVTYTKDGVTASNSPVSTNAITLLVNPQILISKQPGTGTDTTSTVSYVTNISSSGNATLSVTSFTTAPTAISYSWEWRWSDQTTYTPILSSNPQLSTTPFRLVTGTNGTSAILQLERVKLLAGSSSNLLYIRVSISGLSGEQTVTSNDAGLYLTQTAVIDSPTDDFAIEDRYGPVPNRSSYQETQQTITVAASVDVSIDTGVRGPITLGWQRKYAGETGWTDVGITKNDAGTDLPASTSTDPRSSGSHTFTTPPLRRSTDHLSQYRMYVTYLSGGNSVTTYSDPCTISVYRTAYIDNDPGNSEVFQNSIASFSVTASPSSGTDIAYKWEYSLNGTTWSDILNNPPLLNVTSITYNSYTATVTCSSAHGLVSGDRVYVAGVTPLTYNGVWTVLSTGLTSTQFTYTMFNIPTTNGIGPFTVHRSPRYVGINTSSLLIYVASSSILERYYRCVLTVPDSIGTVETGYGSLIIRSDAFLGISSINDRQVQEYESVTWTVNATSASLSTPAYQWQKSTNYTSANPNAATWSDIVGANSPTFTISSVLSANAGFYRCRVISAGSTINFSNVARLQVLPVTINITTNTPTSLAIEEDFAGTTLSVVASSTTPGTIQYQWQLKPAGSSTWSDAPVGFNQTNTVGENYRIPSLSISDSGNVYRCRLTISGNPNTYYTNETTVRVDRVFNYFADAATKNITQGSTLILDISPFYTGTDTATYRWQASITGPTGTYFNLSDGINGPLYNINIDGATSSQISLYNIPSSLSNAYFRCVVTFNQVKKVKYYRSSPITLIYPTPVNTFNTEIIRIVVTTAIIESPSYNDQRQKVGAAIGTVICVPKPADYIEDPSAITDDADRWKIALTGQMSSGSPAQGVSNTTRPYGPNDRFPGFIEMRGQLLKAQDFPDLARILGNTYGGNIPSTRQYPNYQSTDVFRLPCPYGKYLLGTGNVDNNRSSPSVVPLYAPDGSSGGQIGTAGSMGGEYNFEKYDQLPPGSPNISGETDGTAPTVSPYLFTVGTFRTDGWENCTVEVDTQFTGTTTYQISDSAGIAQVSLSGPPPHTHRINSIVYSNTNRVYGGSGNCGANQSISAVGVIRQGPEGVINNSRNPSRTHSHALSFDPNDSTLGEGTGETITPPSGGESGFSYTSPGNYVFTVPSTANSFTFTLYSASGGGGGNDAANPGSAGGAGARVTGTCTNIPGGSSIRVIIPFAGGGGSGCVSNAGAGNGGGSQGTGFGGGSGGRSGGQGCSGGGGGGGGAAFMYCETVGSGPNPNGLQRGTILVIVGGGGGGGGSGYHNNNTRPRFPGGAASTSWASSTINSSSYYTNQSTLTFRAYDANGANPVSGRIGADRGANADGGGGGGGGGGFTGGSGGGNAGGDVNAPGGSGGTSAYNSSFFSAAPGLSTGYSGGAAGGANNNGSTGSATITVISSGGGTTGSNPSTGGVNSADHNGNWGVLRGSANQFLSESINHHITTGTAQNLGITLPSGTITMSTRSRSTFDNYLNFYMRNNEPIPIQQPYFRLKYLIKAF
jgi:hypothetical protein